MQPHHALEPAQPLQLPSLESFRDKIDCCLNFLGNSLWGILKSLVTTMNGSKGNLDNWTHQRDRRHLVEVQRVYPAGFQSLASWAPKQSFFAESMRLSNRSKMGSQGCSSESYFIGRRLRGGVGPIGHLGTYGLPRKTQEVTPNARQDAASGYSTSSLNLAAGLCEFASGHGSSQHVRCAGFDALTRGVHSQAIPTDPCLELSRNLQAFLDTISSNSEAVATHTALPLIRTLRACQEAISSRSKPLATPQAILLGQDFEIHRKASKFRNINILFHTRDGITLGFTALQDTGADQNAISEDVVKQLGYWDSRREFTEADKPGAPLALGGNAVSPLATVELAFWTPCGCHSGNQIFNIYAQRQLPNYEIILDAALVQGLKHLKRIFCTEACSIV